MRFREVASPQGLSEALGFLKRHPESIPYAGGTWIMSGGADHGEAPMLALSLDRVPELKTLARTERFLELGSRMTLSNVLAIAPTVCPPALRDAIALAGNVTVRNLATIGGSIACRERFLFAFPVLSCLDSVVELRSHAFARWIPVQELADATHSIPRDVLITRIRVPIAEWNARIVRRIGPGAFPIDGNGLFVVIARIEKYVLSDFRLAIGGVSLMRSRSLEMSLIGKRLPFQPKDIETFVSNCDTILSNTAFPERMRATARNIARAALEGIEENIS